MTSEDPAFVIRLTVDEARRLRVAVACAGVDPPDPVLDDVVRRLGESENRARLAAKNMKATR